MMKEHQASGEQVWTKERILKNAARLAILCSAWYTLSAAENIISKIILTDFPYPLTASVCHSVFITIVIGPVLKLWRVPPNPTLSKRYYFSVIVPLAFGKVMASFTSQFSLSKIPVSYAHTVKASMPIFTVLLSRLLIGEKNPWRIYGSLVPIVGGIILATVTEISFSLPGLISALISTCSFSLQNIYSKKCMKDTGLHHLRLLFELCKLGSLFLIPLWLLTDVPKWSNMELKINTPMLVFLLLVDCFCNFAHSMVAFTIISLVTPLSYSVANATKRIVIITMSLITLKNPVTSMNILGMSIAILGVLLYNKVKLDEAKSKKSISHSPSNVLLPNSINERFTTINFNQTPVPSGDQYASQNSHAANGSVPYSYNTNSTKYRWHDV